MRNVRGVCSLLTVVVLLWPGALRAEQPGEPSHEVQPPRHENQQPGQPPPYYFYAYGPNTTEHRDLTIEQAIAAALGQASAYQQSRLDEQIADEDESQARIAYLPQLTIPLTYFGTTPASLSGPNQPALPSFIASNGIHHSIGYFSASGTLDVAGRLGAAVRRSRDLLAAAHAGTAAAQRTLVFATVDAYFGLSLARQKRRIADETLALAESFVELTRQLAADAKAEPAELLRARAEALRRRDELEQARVAESSAADALRALTGVPPSVHLGVERPSGELAALGGSDANLEDSIARRPQLLQLDALKLATLEEARAARAERRPQLAYTLNAGFEANETREFKSFLGASAIVSLTIPVSNFGASRSREAQALLRAQSLDLLRENTRRQLEQELYTARATVLSARERIRQSQDRATASEQALNSLLSRYVEGKATTTEMLDAQSAYADARSAYSQAITDYNTARVRLAVDPAQLDFKSARQESLPARPAPATCSLHAAQAPPIAGLRLGASVAEVSRLLSGAAPAAPNELGVAKLEVDAPALHGPAPEDPAFSIAHLSLGFYDGALYSIRVVYSGATEWDTKDAFLAAASERLGLPGPWKPFYDWSSKRLESDEDLRDLAVECSGFRFRVGLGYFSEGVRRVLTPHVKLDDTSAVEAVLARAASQARR